MINQIFMVSRCQFLPQFFIMQVYAFMFPGALKPRDFSFRYIHYTIVECEEPSSCNAVVSLQLYYYTYYTTPQCIMITWKCIKLVITAIDDFNSNRHEI